MTNFHRLSTLFAFLLAFLLSSGCNTSSGAKDVAELNVNVEETRALVGPGDVIEVRVFREKELSGLFEINAEGELRLPLLDAMKVESLTTTEITHKIEAAYNENLLKNAQVSVFVKEYNSRKVIVVGEVKKPGPVPFRIRMTVIEAVTRAGGITRLAAPDRTIIIREKNGIRERYKIDLAAVKRGESKDIVLMPGDIVSVPVSVF